MTAVTLFGSSGTLAGCCERMQKGSVSHCAPQTSATCSETRGNEPMSPVAST